MMRWQTASRTHRRRTPPRSVVEEPAPSRVQFWDKRPIFPSFTGQLETEPRAVGAGCVLQKCSLPWLWKYGWKPSQRNVLLLWERRPQAHQRCRYKCGNNCTFGRECRKDFVGLRRSGWLNAISLQWITAWASLSFHLQGSFLWDTTADSWAGSTPLASASNHPTMIRRKCGMEAARWVSTPNRSWEANSDYSAENRLTCSFHCWLLRWLKCFLACRSHPGPQHYWLHCFRSGSELPDTRRTDGPEPGPLPPQRSLWVHPETQFLVQPHVQLQSWEHGRRTWTHPHPAYHTRECQSKLITIWFISVKALIVVFCDSHHGWASQTGYAPWWPSSETHNPVISDITQDKLKEKKSEITNSHPSVVLYQHMLCSQCVIWVLT